MDNVKTFTYDDIKDISAKGKVLVDFWASWCGPCRMVSPIVDRLAEEYAGKITVGKLNIDEYPQAATENNVASIPTLVTFDSGVEVERMIGAHGQEDIADMIDRLIAR
ncbi:MAG: thioredoxin [Clostridia bacterium]|nr:thioredoxin [Clostridia bacterium]